MLELLPHSEYRWLSDEEIDQINWETVNTESSQGKKKKMNNKQLNY